MYIEFFEGKYRLVENELGKQIGPWASNGDVSTVGDYGTDGMNIYRIVAMKPKKFNILKINGEQLGCFDLKPMWSYVRTEEKHMLICGSEIVEGPHNKQLTLGNTIARTDGSVVEEF